MMPQYPDCIYLVERVVDGVTHLVSDQRFYDLCVAEKQALGLQLLAILVLVVVCALAFLFYLTRD